MSSANQCQNCTRLGLLCIYETKPKRQEHTLSNESLKWESPAWDSVTMDVCRNFHERFPGVTLDSGQFSIISKLFQEAVQSNEQGSASRRDSAGGKSSNSLRRISRPRASITPQPVGTSASVVVGVCISRNLSNLKYELIDLADNTPSASHASFLAAISDTISPVYTKDQDTPVYLGSLAQEEDPSILITVLSQLPPYEDAQLLVNVFFTFLESNWYYFDKKWFRHLLTEVYMSKANAPQQQQCTAICLVLLVLALGSTFEHLFRPTKLLVTDRGIPGSTFFVPATKLMPGVIAANSVESATCCLLTSLYLLATEDIPHHHIYLGLALNLAVGLSLHRIGMRSDETPQAHESKVRLFWTIYSIERQTSVIMGLPTMLQRKDITVSLPQRRHELDEDGSHRVDRLVAFTKLTIIMDKIISAGPIEQSSPTYIWAFSELESWKESVPAHLLFAEGPSFRASAHLNIMYNMIWVNIGRGATLRLVRRRLYPIAADYKDLNCDDLFLRSQKLAERCTESAANIINWIVQLHSRKLLAKFSFTDFHTCSSAVIVLLLNAVIRSPYHQTLPITQGIEALRFMASGSELAMNALLLVERLQEGVSTPSQISSRSSNLNLAETTNNSTSDNTAPDFTPLSLGLFADLEPSLLEYSEQYLTLFGFAGFESTFDRGFPV
ncbi:unnamed protein product [Penicillium pancosmium]